VAAQRLTLSARVTLLWLAAVIVVGLLAVASGLAVADSRAKTDKTLNQIGPIRTLSEQLLSAVVNQEAGVRGYAMSADEADLRPYNDGVSAELTAAAQIDAGLSERPDLRAQLQQVEQATTRWRQDVATPVITAVRAGNKAGAQALLTDRARAEFEGIRSQIEQLQAGIRSYRDDLTDSAWQAVDRTTTLLYGFGAAVLVVGVIVLIALRRLVTRPVTDLTAQIQAVAAGDYNRKIVASGADELITLAHDVDTMRERIAAELHDMGSARNRLQQALTEVNRLNAELELRANELLRSNRDLEQFAYVASHDLQEPLRKVASFCQLLQRRYAGRLDEKADQYIGFAVEGAQRMQQLINDLLAFSRIGRTTTDFADVDLATVVADCLAQLEYPIKQTQAEVSADNLPVVRGEPALLTALLANLIGNAVKFHRPGVPPQVRISAEKIDDRWHITCTDNGIGIDPEQGDRVFVIFQRLQPRDQYAGTGIGLAIAKKIVEYHGGEIWVSENPDGPGAAVTFTLPMEPVAATPTAVAQLNGDRSTPRLAAVPADHPAVPAASG
jgi:signal transduction histidine kinase